MFIKIQFNSLLEAAMSEAKLTVANPELQVIHRWIDSAKQKFVIAVELDPLFALSLLLGDFEVAEISSTFFACDQKVQPNMKRFDEFICQHTGQSSIEVVDWEGCFIGIIPKIVFPISDPNYATQYK